MKTIHMCMMVLVFCIAVFSGASASKEGKVTEGKGKGGKTGKISVEYGAFPETLKRFDTYPWESLKIEEFRKSYTAMLTGRLQSEWISNLTGTGNRNKLVRSSKRSYVLIASCKPHSCDSDQILVLYEPGGKRCWGIQAESGKFTYLGNPPEDVTGLLKILLVEEYKEIYKGQ